MSGSKDLPRFARPPVSEVVLGIFFTCIPEVLPTIYGSMSNALANDFPHVEVLAAVPPFLEPPSPAQPVSNFSASTFWPRVLLISNDKHTLVQIQVDRLYFTWRKHSPSAPLPGSDYPEYEEIARGFAAAYSSLLSCLGVVEGALTIKQCEVFYVNPLEPHLLDAQPSEPEKVFSVWNPAAGAAWTERLEDLSFNARYKLRAADASNAGRLTATMGTYSDPAGAASMRLEMAARGAARGPGLAGIAEFHEIGHSAIVRAFAAMTTPQMHERWGRLQ